MWLNALALFETNYLPELSVLRKTYPCTVCYGGTGMRFIHRGSEHSELGTMRPKAALVVPSPCVINRLLHLPALV